VRRFLPLFRALFADAGGMVGRRTATTGFRSRRCTLGCILAAASRPIPSDLQFSRTRFRACLAAGVLVHLDAEDALEVRGLGEEDELVHVLFADALIRPVTNAEAHIGTAS